VTFLGGHSSLLSSSHTILSRRHEESVRCG
jgi:hypothetical protein